MSYQTIAGGTCEAKLEIDFWVDACATVARVLGTLSDENKTNLVELLQVMWQSEEEMDEGKKTIKEMLSPLVGTLLPLEPSGDRDPYLRKWSRWVGGKVREYRNLAGLTQDELANKAGLPQSHISRIERGDLSPTRTTIEKIAKALSRAVSDFDPSE